MGGLMSRNKGKRGEREVIDELQPIIDSVYSELRDKYKIDVGDTPVLQRNTLQSDKGGEDIAGLAWMALEVKYQEKEQLGKWWEQTVRQAGKKKIAVLVHRANRQSWRVRMRGALLVGPSNCGMEPIPIVADFTLDEFLIYFERKTMYEAWRAVS